MDSTYDSFIPEDLPYRFEAGLQNYSGMIGLGEACRYLQKIGATADVLSEVLALCAIAKAKKRPSGDEER